MAIQFACPSCTQPIEVDDTYAGRNAICPYCRREVVVPASSTYAAAGVVARPAQPGGFPLPPTGGRQIEYGPRAVQPNPFANWALFFTAAMVACLVVAAFAMVSLIATDLPPGAAQPTAEEMEAIRQKLMQDMPKHPVLPIASCMVPVFGVVGLGLAIAALRRGGAPVRSWLALIVCGSFCLCAGYGVLTTLVGGASPVGP